MDFCRLFHAECETPFQVEEEERGNIFCLRPVWRNDSSHPETVGKAVLTFDLPMTALQRDFCCSSMQMGSHWEKYEFASLKGMLVFSGLVLMRTVAGKFLLAGTVSCRKNLAEWKIGNGRLELHCYGDGKMLESGGTWSGDLYGFLERDTLYEALTDFGKLIAEVNPHVRKRQTTLWRGWGSWDYYGNKFNEQLLLDNFVGVRALYPEANLLQIDDGTTLWGDWLDIKQGWIPDGMPAFVRKVRAMNAHAGLWMAPFLGSHSSKLFQEHPDWFLHRSDGTLLSNNTLSPLDYSQDEVCDWWRNVVHTARREWGFDYFKFDFLAGGLYPVPGKDRSMSPVERFHRCFDIIEEEAGDDTFILGCSASFLPIFGRVDAVRTGPDISPRYQSALQSSFGNFSNLHLCGTVFRGDGDYLVVRSAEEEDPEIPVTFQEYKSGTFTLDEAKLWGDAVTLLNRTVLVSDCMKTLRPERAEIIRNVLSAEPADEVFALDLFKGDGLLPPSVLLARRGKKIELALFNWSGEEKQITVLDQKNQIVLQKNLQPHCSHRQPLETDLDFAGLAKTLHTDEPELPRPLPHFDCPEFTLKGKFRPLSLGPAAKVPIRGDSHSGGMLSGLYEGVTEEKSLCGVSFDFSLDSGMVIEQLRSDEKGFTIPLHCHARAIYFVQGAYIPVKNKLMTYTFTYADGTESREEQIVGEHFGNADFRSGMPWNGKKGHIAWYDPFSYAILFVTEWNNPYPEKELLKVESSPLEQPGKHYIVALTALL